MTSDFHARLKPKNRELLDELTREYGVKSAAAALNKLLDRIRGERTPRPVGFESQNGTYSVRTRR